MAKAFKIFYKKVDGQTPTSYTMEHSAGSYVFDTQGRVRLFTRYGVGAEALACFVPRGDGAERAVTKAVRMRIPCSLD